MHSVENLSQAAKYVLAAKMLSGDIYLLNVPSDSETFAVYKQILDERQGYDRTAQASAEELIGYRWSIETLLSDQAEAYNIAYECFRQALRLDARPYEINRIAVTLPDALVYGVVDEIGE